MKVYILIRHVDDAVEIIDVYLTRDLAECALKQRLWAGNQGLDVEEYDVIT